MEEWLFCCRHLLLFRSLRLWPRGASVSHRFPIPPAKRSGFKKRTDGSKSFSAATQSGPQRKSVPLPPKYAENARISRLFRGQTGLQRTDCSAVKKTSFVASLRRADAQSGFEEGTRRMQCDHKPRFSESGLTFDPHTLETAIGVPQSRSSPRFVNHQIGSCFL
jgi:hypothetical protein